MKNFQHPEFHLLHKLQRLQAQYPEIAELAALVTEVKGIINENAIYIVQMAMLYAILGEPGDLSEATKNKLARLLNGAQKSLELDFDEMFAGDMPKSDPS